MMHHVYKSHEKSFIGYTIPSVLQLINRNIKLTISHDNQIIASHIAAFFNMLNHAVYSLLSHHEVIILKPAYRHNITATKDSIHNTRFTAF